MSDFVTLYSRRAGAADWSALDVSDLEMGTEYAASITVDGLEGELTVIAFPVTTPVAQEEVAVEDDDLDHTQSPSESTGVDELVTDPGDPSQETDVSSQESVESAQGTADPVQGITSPATTTSVSATVNVGANPVSIVEPVEESEPAEPIENSD